MKHYKIKPEFSIIKHSADQVELKYGVWNNFSYFMSDDNKEGRLSNLIEDLNGENSSKEIAKKNQTKRSEVESMIDHLMSLGVIEQGDNNILDHYLSNYSNLIPSQETLRTRDVVFLTDLENVEQLTKPLETLLGNAQNGSIHVSGSLYDRLQKIDCARFNDPIEIAKIAAEYGRENTLFVVLQSSIDPIMLFKINKLNHYSKSPWILAAIDGPYLYVGPTFSPESGDTACFECLETRILMNMQEAEKYQKYKNALEQNNVKNHFNPVKNDIFVPLLSAYLNIEVLNYLLTGKSFTQGKMLVIYLPAMEFSYHTVLPYCACTTCGTTNQRDSDQLYFDMSALLED